MKTDQKVRFHHPLHRGYPFLIHGHLSQFTHEVDLDVDRRQSRVPFLIPSAA
jgi:hypothetical protein